MTYQTAMSLAKIIAYYHQCYEADKGRNSLWSVFARDIEHLRFFPSDNDAPDGAPLNLDPAYAHDVHASVQTYRREKKLLFCRHFIVAKADVSQLGGSRRGVICAPLMLADASFEAARQDILSVDELSTRWNYPLLYWLLGGRDNSEKFEDLFDASAKDNSGTYIPSLLQKCGSTMALLPYKQPWQEKKRVENLVAGLTADQVFFCEGAALLLTKRSINARGIIDELSSLVQRERFPAPLLRLFTDLPSSGRDQSAKVDVRPIPGTLSAAQQAILESAAKSDLSVLYGPPGTGKSYTIAAMALERCIAGERVLVVSNNEHAVDVIHSKLTRDFGLDETAVVRAGTNAYIRELKRHIDALLKERSGWEKPAKSQRAYLGTERDLAALWEQYRRRLQVETAHGSLMRIEQKNLWAQLRLWLMEYRGGRMRQKAPTLWDCQKRLRDARNQRESALRLWQRSYLKAKVGRCLQRKRVIIADFRRALGARNSLSQQSRFAQMDFASVVEAMPVWLCSLDSLHRALPLVEGLFDLVIIDEASQCDIASCIPALYRAQRALIVGDTKQLRHMSFLSRRRQNEIVRRLQLDGGNVQSYRDTSILDLAENTHQVDGDKQLLDEHFRSAPNIIAYSNAKFYQSQLKIMTANPQSIGSRSVRIVPVGDGRYEEGMNRPEAAFLIEKLKQLLEEQTLVPLGFKLSIGVLTFFRDQADYLQRLLGRELEIELMDQHDIRVGTPYSFQGEERDVMLISCVVDESVSPATYTYINRPDAFNVGVTRARKLQLMFLSATVDKLPDNSLLFDYLKNTQISKQDTYALQPDLSSEFGELLARIEACDIRCFCDYPLAGERVDVLLLYKSAVAALDIVGFPVKKGEPKTRATYERLSRAGVSVVPLSYFEWRSEPEHCLYVIRQFLHTLNDAQIVSKLSIANVAQCWTKLLANQAKIAPSVKELEESLLIHGLTTPHEMLKNLVDQYVKTMWVLEQKLNPGELTFLRHSSASEQVLLAALESLNQILVIHKGLGSAKANVFDEETSALAGEVKQAIDSLEGLALRWAQAETIRRFADQEMSHALDDLKALTQNIDNLDSDD